MAELTIDASEITEALRRHVAEYTPAVGSEQVGRIVEVGDGIARVSGLPSAAVNELLEFEDGTLGLALNLDESTIGAVVLGSVDALEEEQIVKATGRIQTVPVGDALLGRVVNALGEPIDGKGPIATDLTRRMEVQAPGIIGRQPVSEPLQTGIKAIDAMTPIGRGQRELIIGDRKTGKTAIAIDTILNQKGTGVICVYVAIAQKESTTAALVDVLRRHGALDYTIVVAAGASDPAPMQYISPYAGCAMAEYFMYEQGKPTLVIYDDLSKQAVAYREVSLLLRRPPGREAFPGDIFYAHSRLLERSAKLANHYVILPEKASTDNVTDDMGVDKKSYIGVPGLEEANHALKAHFPTGHKVVKTTRSGGSLTALPIIETLEGEVSAYIPTNVISITDGQIYLQPDLFFAGVRPAIDVGISVSRVGGKAQIPAMKKVAGGLRLDLAAFRELEAFAQLGTELDRATQKQLDRGYRMVELLKQPQYKPMNAIDQVMSIFAGTQGHLDDVPRADVSRWETSFMNFINDRKPEVRAALEREQKMTPKIEADLTSAIAAFKAQFK
jgi:F-type H+/Na+-transporting ATPase subunit alpha